MPKTGVWEGWYRYDGDREEHPWSFAITLDGTRFGGEGADDVGRFTVDGQVDGDVVRWTKRYDFSDDADAAVHYRGKLDADGRFVGDWKLADGTHGTCGAHWTDAESLPEPTSDLEDEAFGGGGNVEFDVASFRELIREIRPFVQQIETRYRKRFPNGLPHWTELPEEALAELPGGDDSMNDLFGFFTAIDEHAFDGLVD